MSARDSGRQRCCESGEGKRAEEYETVTSHRNGVAKGTRARDASA
jgi:hypothetical protein